MKALSNPRCGSRWHNPALGVSIPVTITDFTLSTGPATSATGHVLGFAYTNLGTTGEDVQLTYTVGQPGLSAVTVGTVLPSPAGAARSCSGPSNGASSPAPT